MRPWPGGLEPPLHRHPWWHATKACIRYSAADRFHLFAEWIAPHHRARFSITDVSLLRRFVPVWRAIQIGGRNPNSTTSPVQLVAYSPRPPLCQFDSTNTMPVATFQPEDQLLPENVKFWLNDIRLKSIFHAIESFILMSTPGPHRIAKEPCPKG